MKKEEEKNEEKARKKGLTNKFIIIMSILSFVAFLFLAYSISLISGIETELRYIVIGILFLINIIIIFLLRKIVKKEKKSRYIIYLLVVLIMTIGQGYLGYFIYKTYSSIDNINKNEITYSTSIISLKSGSIDKISDLKSKKIGIVVDKTSIDNYILGKKLISDKKLDDNNTIVEYDNVSSLINDLYGKKIDAVIISSNYSSMFSTIDKYKNISSQTIKLDSISKTYTKSEIAKITGDDKINLNSKSSITEPFTMLIMGIDSTAETLDKNASGNGDALMLVTFNPKTLNATILSIPRDSYVYIPCLGFQNKITHAAWGGESCMSKAIEGLTGINIDYYVKVNFKGVVKLVDLLGGVNINVPIEFCEQNSSRTWGSSTICLKKGEQLLNGEQALALARHRKTLLTGDLQRGTDQQLVVQGILNQIKTVKSANQALNILDTMSNSMDTNFTTKQLLSFYDIFKSLIETSSDKSNLINIQQLYLSGSGEMIYDERTGLVLYNYIVNESSLNQIVKVMKQNLGLTAAPASTKEMDFDIEEPYSMTTIGKDNLSATKLFTLLPDFTGSSLTYAKNWLSKNGISNVKVEYQESTKTEGTIISQDLPESKRIDLIKNGITFTVAKESTKVEETPTDVDTDNDKKTDTDNKQNNTTSNNQNSDTSDTSTNDSSTNNTENNQ